MFLSGTKQTFIDVIVFNELDQILTVFADFKLPPECTHLSDWLIHMKNERELSAINQNFYSLVT